MCTSSAFAAKSCEPSSRGQSPLTVNREVTSTSIMDKNWEQDWIGLTAIFPQLWPIAANLKSLTENDGKTFSDSHPAVKESYKEASFRLASGSYNTVLRSNQTYIHGYFHWKLKPPETRTSFIFCNCTTQRSVRKTFVTRIPRYYCNTSNW